MIFAVIFCDLVHTHPLIFVILFITLELLRVEYGTRAVVHYLNGWLAKWQDPYLRTQETS